MADRVRRVSFLVDLGAGTAEERAQVRRPGKLPGEHEDPAKRLALYKGFPIYLHKGNLRDENGAVGHTPPKTWRGTT